MSNGPVLPHEVLNVLVNHYLKKAKNRLVSGNSGAEDLRDILGTETLGVLIEILEVARGSTEQRNRVAGFVLENTTRFNHSFYVRALTSLSPHVSIEMRERIVKHFVQYGDIVTVRHITATQLHRNPTEEELVSMVEYHRGNKTSSDAPVWRTLYKLCMDLEEGATMKKIKDALEEIEKSEREPDFY